MGACLAKLGVANPIGDIPELVTADMMERIGTKLIEILSDLQDSFYWERQSIIWDMWRCHCKGEDYKHEVFGDNPQYKEYPGNEMKVAILTLKVAGGEKLKDLLCGVIHDMVDPEINPKVEQLASPLRNPALKAAAKAIEKAVDDAVDKAISVLREKLEGGKFELPGITPKEGEDKPSGENPMQTKHGKKG